MLAGIFIGALIVSIFVFQMAAMWWRQNAWRRRWNDKKDDE
jgi:hypothetical protein